MVGGCKKDIHRARWSNPRSPKQWCKDEPNRAQPKQGCLSLHPGVQLHLQVVDAHLQRSNPFSRLESSPQICLCLAIIVSLPCLMSCWFHDASVRRFGTKSEQVIAIMMERNH